jgi:hypothetical protein
VVELQLRLRAAVPAAATVPQPYQLFDIIRDHVSAPRLVLWLHAHGNHRFRMLDAPPLTLLL